MAWNIVQSNNKQTLNSLQTANVSLTSSPVTGRKVLVVIAAQSALTLGFSSVTDSNSNTLTQCLSVLNTSGFSLLGLFAYDVPAAPSTTFTVSLTGAALDNVSMGVVEVSGLATGNTTAAMLDGSASTKTGTATPTTVTGYSSTAVNELDVALFGDAGAGATVTVPSGYTLLTGASFNTDSNADLIFAYKNSTNGAESDAFTYLPAAGNIWETGDVAFKLPAAAAVVPRPIMVNRSYFTG